VVVSNNSNTIMCLVPYNNDTYQANRKLSSTATTCITHIRINLKIERDSSF